MEISYGVDKPAGDVSIVVKGCDIRNKKMSLA